MNALMDQLLKLPLAEKLQIIDALWEDVSAELEPVSIPKKHKEEMRRRAKELVDDPSIAISEEELWERVERSDD